MIVRTLTARLFSLLLLLCFTTMISLMTSQVTIFGQQATSVDTTAAQQQQLTALHQFAIASSRTAGDIQAGGATTQTPTASLSSSQYQYVVLAANKTSTLEKELNEAGATGYRFEGVMGGATSFGGSESVVVMSKNSTSDGRYDYKLLSASKTSTMQKELEEAGKDGFAYAGMSVAETLFGGSEIVVITRRARVK